MIYVLSGGANLNYKIVGGTTQPTSPAENTIWVNTSTAITSHVFSTTQPENPVEGMVWFQTGTNSGVAFNALKKNCIEVYPSSCQQYEGGAWASKIANTYQGGEWKSWVVYFFNNGDLGESGGFELVSSTCGGSITVDSSIVCKATDGDGSSNKKSNAYFSSKNTINLTGKKTLKITGVVANISSDGAYAYVGVSTAKDGKPSSYITLTKSSETHTLSVSDLSGDYYVAIRLAADYNYSNTATVTLIEFT